MYLASIEHCRESKLQIYSYPNNFAFCMKRAHFKRIVIHLNGEIPKQFKDLPQPSFNSSKN